MQTFLQKQMKGCNVAKCQYPLTGCVITAATFVVSLMLCSAQGTTTYCEENNVQQKYHVEVVCV